MKHTLLVFIALIFFFKTNYSQEIWGGVITYKNISPKKYEIKTILFYNCFKPKLDSVAVGIKVSTYNQNLYLQLNNDSDLYNLCPSKISTACNTDNSSRGIRQAEYTTVLDFNAGNWPSITSGVCDVYLSFTYQNRLSSINTIDPNDNFYIESYLNICNDYSSPQLKQRSIFQACCNYPFLQSQYYEGLQQFDSISYDLVEVRKSHVLKATYQTNYTKSIPFKPYCPPNNNFNCPPLPNAKPPRGFYFSKTDGSIIFTPTECNEVGVYAYDLKYFKLINNEMTLMGYINYETIIKVEQCTNNNPPSLVGIRNYTLCEGNKITFRIDSKDDQFLPQQTSPDTTDITWKYNTPGTSINVINPNSREKSIEINVQSKIGDARNIPYTIIVYTKDNNCSSQMITSKTILITISENAKKEVTSTIKGNAIKINYWGDSKNNFSFEIKNDSNQIIHRSFNKIDSVNLVKKGKNYIAYDINNSNNCPSRYYDTITIANNLNTEHLIKTRFNCYPNPSSVFITIQSEQSNEFEIQMTDILGQVVIRKKVKNGDNIDVTGLESGIYFLRSSIHDQSIKLAITKD